MKKGTLILFCGKMGSGKSTQSKQLEKELSAVLLSEDEWLSTLFPEEIHTLEDYLKYSSRLKSILREHIKHILSSGISVILDFPANTRSQRMWFASLINEIECPHKLIYLQADDELCLQRLSRRRIEIPQRADFDTEVVFRQVTKFFSPPEESENLNIEIIRQEKASGFPDNDLRA